MDQNTCHVADKNSRSLKCKLKIFLKYLVHSVCYRMDKFRKHAVRACKQPSNKLHDAVQTIAVNTNIPSCTYGKIHFLLWLEQAKIDRNKSVKGSTQ